MKFFVASSYGYWGSFKPTDLRDPTATVQIGGGETAMVNIARELAALGHDVTVFYNTARPGKYEGVNYVDAALFEHFACQIEHDVLVSWDLPHAFKTADRAKLHVLCFQLNDAQVGVFEHSIDLYFHPSNWHAARFAEIYPELSKNKMRAGLTNGVDVIRYAQDVERDPFRVVYSSSPDRGLHHLLRIWPRIVEQVPQANLHVYYDMNKWLQLCDDLAAKGLYVNTYERAMQVRSEMSHIAQNGIEKSVTYHGGIGQWQLAREQLKASIMCYPCDPVQPTEGFSMSCLEGITAGCTLITSNADALPEMWTDAPDATLLPLPVDDGVWVDAICKALIQAREPRVAKLPEHFLWRSIATRWEQEIAECLATK